MKVATFDLLERDNFQLKLDTLRSSIEQGDLVIIGTPNNPTGISCNREQLLSLAKEFSTAFFVFDEAFLEFSGERLSLAACAPNIITLNSMTKFYGVPGLRIGYGTFPLEIAELVRENLPPWTVNSLAQAVGIKALCDCDYQQKTRQVCQRLRMDLMEEIRSFNELHVYEASANYLLVKIKKGRVILNWSISVWIIP